MRVAVDVTPTLSGHTGVARYTRELLAHLPAAGVEPRSFAVGRGAGQLPAGTRHVRIPLRVVQRGWRRGLPPRAEDLVSGADLVHSLDLLPPSTRRPLVATVHDVAALDRPDLHPPRATEQQRRQVDSLGKADAVLAVSQATAAALTRYGVARDRVRVTHLASTLPGGEPDATGSADRREPALLLAVGELAARKDYPTLIRAVAAADVAGLRLVIAGPMGYRGDEVASMVRRLDLDDRVILLGRVDDNQLIELYRSATALCLPSVIEGFGLPLIEAMAAGLPIVASDIDVVREITAGAALLAPVGDVDGFSAAISRITSDRDLRSRLADGGLRRSADFSWQQTAAQTAGIYRDVLARSGCAS